VRARRGLPRLAAVGECALPGRAAVAQRPLHHAFQRHALHGEP
jgi:hypothetical protein